MEHVIKSGAEKQIIGELAAQLLPNMSAIFLDSGSMTVLHPSIPSRT